MLPAHARLKTIDCKHDARSSTPQGRQFRYAKMLPVQPGWLTCRGDPVAMSDGMKARLAAEYPLDGAISYAPRMLRGIVAVSFPP